MEKKITPEDQSELQRRISEAKTKEGEPCAGFQITENKEGIRLNEKQFRSDEMSGEWVVNCKELGEMIYKRASGEKQGNYQMLMELNMREAFARTIDELVTSLQDALKTFKEDVDKFIKMHLLDSSNKFKEVIWAIKNEEFDARLDAAVIELAMEARPGAQSDEWSDGFAKELMTQVQQLQDQTLKSLAKSKEKLRATMISSLFNFKGIQKGKESIEKMKKMSIGKAVCRGNRGISFRPGKEGQVAILSEEPVLNIFDSNKGELLHQVKCESEKGESVNNSVSFSPNGDLVLVSIEQEASLIVFKSEGLAKVKSWSRKESGKTIQRAKWLNDLMIIVSYGEPGLIELIDISSGSQLAKITPEKTKNQGVISDFDISKWKDSLVCAGTDGKSDSIFKILIENGSSKLEWEHSSHHNTINVVRLSNCGHFVFSGGSDEKIILASEKDGSIILDLNCFSDPIFGFIFTPDDRFVFVQSSGEIVLLSWKKFEEESIDLNWQDTIKKGQLGSYDDIYAFGASWDSVLKKNHRLLLGTEGGKIFKLQME